MKTFDQLIELYLTEPVIENCDPKYKKLMKPKGDYIIHNRDYGVTVTVDNVFNDKGKTNVYVNTAEREIIKTSETFMKAPLDKIPNNIYAVNALRVNLYAYLSGKEPGKLCLVQYGWEQNLHAVRNRFDLIREWLEHYKNNSIIKEEAKNKKKEATLSLFGNEENAGSVYAKV